MSQLAPTQPPLVAQAPPGQPPGSTSAPPGAADREPPFEAALDAELARTAPAEGQGAEQQQGDRAGARRDRHNRSADDMLAGAASALAAAAAAGDSRSGTATAGSVVPSDLSADAVGTEVGEPQPPGTQSPEDAQAAVGRAGAESIELGEQAGGIGPEATPDPATTASHEDLISAPAAPSEAQAAQRPASSATSALTSTGVSAAPIALGGSATPAEAQELSPSQVTTRAQQQLSSAPQIPVAGLSKSAQDASETTSTSSERTQTSSRPGDERDDKGSATDAAPAAGSATAQTGSDLAASSSGNRLPADTEAEARVPQDLADSTADAAAPGVLDNSITTAVQAAPVSTLQTPSETPTSQPAAGPGIALQQAVDSLQATVELAARQGLTQARIQLHPAELGEIRIHLTQTSAGLLARVSAESAAAAQALIAAHGELRQSLSSLGIDLAQLHVGAHEAAGADLGQQGAGGQQQAGAQQQPSAQASGDRRDGRASAADGPDEQVPSIDRTTDPSGALGAVESVTGTPAALIDVLA